MKKLSLAIILILTLSSVGCQSVIAPALEVHKTEIAGKVADQVEVLIVEVAIEQFGDIVANDAAGLAMAVREKIYFYVVEYINRILKRLRDA